MIASQTVNGGPLVADGTSLHANSITFSEFNVRFAVIEIFGNIKFRDTNRQVSFRTDGSSASTTNLYFDSGVLGMNLARRAIPDPPLI